MFSMFDEMYEIGKKRAKGTLWVFSDLQQARYEDAEKCLKIGIEDYEIMNRPANMIFYLGDSTESANLPELYRMTDLQEKAFSELNIPLCYAPGNHDYDYAEHCYRNNISELVMPFYQMVQNHPGWYTSRSCEDLWFSVPFDNWRFYFICDHVAKDNSWCATHNKIRYGTEKYPYNESHFRSISEHMQHCGSEHIITASHCAFPGGNRGSTLMKQMQPLPLNVHLHLYGHSHIGEYTCPGERVFSQIQWVDWQDIPQIDVASFEDIRGSYCRSVYVQIYEDDTLGVFFRNNNEHRFVSAFFPTCHTQEVQGMFEQQKRDRKPWD